MNEHIEVRYSDSTRVYKPEGLASPGSTSKIVLHHTPGGANGVGHIVLEVTDQTGRRSVQDIPQGKNKMDCLYKAAMVGKAVLDGKDLHSAMQVKPEQVKDMTLGSNLVTKMVHGIRRI